MGSSNDRTLKVLIVEDSRGIIKLIQIMLSEATMSNFIAESALSLADAKDLLSKKNFDIILLDLNLPDSMGLETLISMKENYPYIPIIVITGAYEDEIGLKAIAYGAQDYLVKNKIDNYILEKSIHFAIERKKTEVELMKATIILRTIIDGVTIMDTAGTITDLNGATIRQLGYTKEEMIGKAPTDIFITEKFKIKFFHEIVKLLSGEPIESSVYQFKRKDGKVIPISINFSIIKNSDDKAQGIVAVHRDISNLKKAEAKRINLEKELQHAKKLESIGTLAAGIAHEINTPMQYIGDNTLFFSEAIIKLFELINIYQKYLIECNEQTNTISISQLVDQAEENADLDYLRDEIPAAISQSLEGIDRVKKIVSAMKDFSRMDNEEKSKSDINKAIESTVIVSRNEWKYVSDVETNLDPSLPPVSCWINEINQVIMNLIVNAAHAITDVVGDGTKGKGLINIKTLSNGGSIEISISDTGTGIPEEIKDRIFDQFFTTKDVGRGSGQGLSIAHNIIVNKHKGSITVDSEVGKGSTFDITLPIDG